MNAQHIYNPLEDKLSYQDIRKIRSRLLEQNFIIASLREFLRMVLSFSSKEVEDLLTCYTDKNTLRFISKRVDINKLLALLLYIGEKYTCFGKPLLNIIFEEETEEFQFIGIILPDCDWKSWKKIVIDIKNEMRKAGMKELTSKVAIICLQGL